MRRIYQIGRNALIALAVAAGALSVPAAPAHASAWTANEDDALLFDVRVGNYRLGDGVRGYQTTNGPCVDMGDIVMAFDLPVRIDKKSRRATGWLFEEKRLITIDRDQNMVQIVNKPAQLANGDIYDTPEGWCVNVGTLARWLDVDLKADLSNSLLIVKADRKLPFELAEERKEQASKIRPEKKYDLSKLPQANDPYRFWRMPSIDVVASAGFSNDKQAGKHFDARYDIFASGEIAGASFDARLSSDDRGIPETLRVRGFKTDPQGGLLGPLNATHFEIGDVSTVSTPLAVQNTPGRGLFVTNRPVGRSDSFDRTTFRGELPDGWDAELYRNDQLIGYAQSRGDGRYEFADVALLYGQNRFEVVLYGPQGQIRRDVKMIPVGLDSIPPRETYYWAAFQDSGHDLLNFRDVPDYDFTGLRAGFGFERGLDARTSVAAAVMSYMYRGERENSLEASLRRAIGPTLVEVALAGNLTGGAAARAQMLGQFGQTVISAESAHIFGSFRSERYDNDLRQTNSVAIDHSFKFGTRYVPLHGEFRHSTYANGSSKLEIDSRISFNLKKLNVGAELEWEKVDQKYGPSPPSRLDASLLLSGRIGHVRLRGEAKFGLTGDGGFRDSKLTAEWHAGERADWRAEIGYSGEDHRGRLGVGYTRRFDKLALTGQFEAASDGSVAAGISLAFSLGPDPRTGGIRMSSEKLASNGQALAVVFHDENADGIRQPNEPIEKSVELTAGLTGKGKPTDANGRTFIDGLQPFEPVLIGIDASSLPDPFVQPANSGIVVTPRPGVPVTIELPLVAAGEISGTLIRDGGKILSGVDLELVDQKGMVVRTTRSEYDGYFLFEFVPYGKYKLRVGSLAAGVVGVQQDLPKIAELKSGNGTVDLGIVTAKPALRVAANPAQGP